VGIAEISGIRGLPRVTVPRARARTFIAPCGSARVRIGNATLPLRVTGSAAAFEQGTPLPARSCGIPVALGTGTNQLVVAPGPFAVDELRLSSPAPRPPAVALDTGRVIDSGTTGHGSYDHVLVDVTRPSWLVLGEGYDRGWSAYCNGHSLGTPSPIDGYANGWRVGPGCRQVRFAFSPNRLAAIGYIISALAGLVCVALLVIAMWRRRRRVAIAVAEPAAEDSASPRPAAPPAQAAPDPAPAAWPGPELEPRWPLPRTLPTAVLVGIAFGFVFGIGPGLLSVPAIVLVLWRGIGARGLTLAAGGLLAGVVPILYLVHTGGERGGNHFGYAMAHLGAHYVGVAALGLLMAALWRSLRTARPSFAGPDGRRRRWRARRR
jgi:hypothetical protein